jgi:hypothetical protein
MQIKPCFTPKVLDIRAQGLALRHTLGNRLPNQFASTLKVLGPPRKKGPLMKLFQSRFSVFGYPGLRRSG